MINWRVIFLIARTHLLTKMKSTVTATLGVTFGIGAYITLVSFMTGLNKMLDDLILNQTPHIHLYNEIEPSEEQPVHLFDEFKNAVNVVSNIKPKQNQRKIRNALPILNYLKEHENVRGGFPSIALADLLPLRYHRIGWKFTRNRCNGRGQAFGFRGLYCRR